MEGRYAHGEITFNGIRCFQKQPEHGFMTPAHWYDAAWIDTSVIRMYRRTPRVARLLKRGLSEHDAVTIYVAEMESLLDHVSLVFRGAASRGTVYANSGARSAVDPELAVADSVGDDAPWFTRDGGVSLMFLGLGRLEHEPLRRMREPSPGEIARRDLEHAKAIFAQVAGEFRRPGGTLVVDCNHGDISSFSSPNVLDLTTLPDSRRP